jgi:hypothetical protein
MTPYDLPRLSPVTDLADRRHDGDRRSGVERRGSGRSQAPSATPRPYGFRSFVDRRSGQDRRSERPAPRAVAVGPYDASADDGPIVEITAEEIAVLLDRDAP